MAGPSSPARRAKVQRKKERPSHLHPNVAKFYTPAADSVVHTLDPELTKEGRTWWDKYAGTGKEFESSKGHKGGPDGAMAWVRKTGVTEWWVPRYPQAAKASLMDRAWFLQTAGLVRLIWAHLDNWKRDNEKDLITSTESKKTPKPLVTAFKKKVLAHVTYRHANPSPYKKALKDWEKLYGIEPKVADREKISYSLFQSLPVDEQKVWRDKAAEALKDSRRLAKITDPKERASYLQRFWKTLRELLTEASAVAGIEVCAMVVHDDKDGETHVTREISDGIRGFSNSQGLSDAMKALKKFIEDSAGDNIVYNFPNPTVYPNYSRDGYPCLPNFQGWSLKRLQKLLRDFVKAVFRFQGAVGRMIWKEMKEAMDYWFDPRRLPKVKNLVFNDPSKLDADMVNIWLAFLWACLTGEIPPEERFQFYRVPAGPRSTCIHPSDSQETSREEVTRDGKVVCVLVFKDLVDKCHRVGGMVYKQPAIDFANVLASGQGHANAASAPPSRWLGLPTPGPNVSNSVFFGAELARLEELASLLPETAKTRILKILEVTNEYQAHLPAFHPIGVWLREDGIPLVLARSPQEASTHEWMFWLPLCYFQPAGGPVEGTLYFFEIFQDEMRRSDIILHTSSNTFYGGQTGIVCIIRALVQIYANCLAIRGDFKPLEDPPSNIDTSRFNVQEHDRIVGWLDDWTETIKKHTEILRETSSERKQGLVTVQVQAENPDSDTSDDSSDETPPIPTHSPLSDVLPIAGPSKRSKTQSKGKKLAKKRAFADYTSSSDSDDHGNSKRAPEVDYDALDKASDDDWSTSVGELDTFNERFLDDDAFPSYDLLGLRARYDLDPDVRFHIHRACIPYKEIMREDRWDPIQNEPLFGGFPELPPYKPMRLTRADSVMRELISLESQAKRMKENWDLYNQSNPRFGSDLRHWSKEVAIVAPEAYRPLFRLLHVRVMSWLRAKAMAPYVFAHWKGMTYVGREALYLYPVVKQLLDKDDFPDPSITAQDLVAQFSKSKLQVIELMYVTSELRGWHTLSTKFLDDLRGNWLIRRIPDTMGEIIEIVDGTIKWTDATRELSQTHAEERRRIWEEMMDVPFQPDCAPTNYIFGCPSTGELPSNLHEALELARKANPFDSMMEAILINLDVLVSSPLTQVSPATTPEATPRLSPVPTADDPPESHNSSAPDGADNTIPTMSLSPVPEANASTSSSDPPPPGAFVPLPEPEPKPETETGPTPRPSMSPLPPTPSSRPPPSPPAVSSPPLRSSPSPPPPPPPRKLRKDKAGARTEPQSDIPQDPENIRPVRTSARLQAKTDSPQVSGAPKKGQVGRKVLPRRSNRK